MPRSLEKLALVATPVLALPALAGRLVRRHPRVALPLLVVLAVAGTAAGLYGYALHRWHAAQGIVKEGKPAEARGHIDFCLSVWPRSGDVHRLAARADRIDGDIAGAEAHLNQCLKLEHGATADTQLEFLLLRVQQGEVDEVTPGLMEYVENKHPDAPLVLETIARAYMFNLRYGPALVMLDRWAQESPGAAKPLYWRAWVLERLNEYPRAIADYNRALELDPNCVPVRLRIAEFLLEKSNPPDALPHLEWLTKQCPDRADIKARLGQCRFMQGQTEEARKLLEGAVEQLPDDPVLLTTLGKLELQEGHPVEAEKWFRRLLKADPYDLEAQFNLALSLETQEGRQQEATEARERHQKSKALLKRGEDLMKQEAERPTSDPAPPTEVGNIFLKVGQERLGLYWLHQALERDPNHAPALKALAEHYDNKGERDQASIFRRRLANAEKKKAPAP